MQPYFFPPGVVKTEDQNTSFVKMEPQEMYMNYAHIQEAFPIYPFVKQE